MLNVFRGAKIAGTVLITIIGIWLYFKGSTSLLFYIHQRSTSPGQRITLRELGSKFEINSDNKDLKNNFNIKDHLDGSHTESVNNSDLLRRVQTEMQNRRNQIIRACSKLGESRSDSGNAKKLPRALVSERRAAVYCPVEKTASTFFRRYVYQLEHTEPMRSPFEVPVKMIYACKSLFTTVEAHAQTLLVKRNQQMKKQTRLRKKQKRHNKDKPAQMLDSELGETIDDFLHRSTNFLFVRDPFTRLFSAYVDKLLAPNPEFWSSWGLFAIQKYRKDPHEKSQRCGHDVTFSEFLQFVIDLDLTPPSADPHIRPVFDLCRPCDVNYTVVGFMGSFQNDVIYLSSLLNVSESQLSMDKMAEDTLTDALQDSVMGAFTEWSHRLAECVKKGDIVRRIWRKLQIRGFISSRLNFSPKLLRESVEFLEASDFIKILSNAAGQSTDQKELRRQKTAALISAYRTVDVKILEKIVHLYAVDFRVFGFNQRPKFLFDRDSSQPIQNYSQALDYRAEWVL